MQGIWLTAREAVISLLRQRLAETVPAPPNTGTTRFTRKGPTTRLFGPLVMSAVVAMTIFLFSPSAVSAKSVKYSSDLAISSYVAQVPPSSAFKAPERSDDELLILKMTTGNFLLRDAIFGFPKQGSLILPLTDIVDAFEFPITVDVDAGTANGWFIDENRLFSLDLAARQVVIAGKVQSVDPAFVEQLPDDIYVDVRTLARWFPVDFNYDIPNLILEITSREDLPFEARLARDDRRKKTFGRRGGDKQKFPKLDVPYKWISWPVSDTTVDFTVNSSDDGPTLSRSFNTLATADLVKLNADVFVSGTQDDQLSIVRVKLGRKDPKGGLLGKLDATQFDIGDIFGPQISHMARSSLGRGFTVSNEPLGDQQEFDRVTLQGDLQLGWEVELYRNEVLLDFRESQTDGRYLFEDVPLLFGVNVIKLSFYGPQGQTRDEIQQLRVGPDQVKPGKHNYTFAFNQQDRLTLIGDDDAVSTSDFQGKARYTGQYKYGVNKNLSVGANIASVPFEGGHRRYIGGNAVTSLGPVYGRLDVTKDVSGGWAGTLSAQTRLFGTSVLLEHTYLNDFLSEEYSEATDPLESETRVRVDGVIRTGFLPQIPYAFNLTHEASKSRDRTTTLQNRLSTAIGRASVSNTLSLTLSDPAESDDSKTASGTLQLGGRIGKVRTRGQLSYSVSPEMTVNSASISADWKLNERFNAQGGVTKALTGDELASYSLGANTDLEYVAVGLSGEYSDDNSYSSALRLTYSWGKDAADGGLRVASKPTAERGTMTARVYRDWDGDGVYTEGVDEPLKGVKFKSGRLSLKQKTNKEGLAFLTSLDAFAPVNFQVDQASLEDPFWIASPEGVEVTLRPGAPGRVDFAVVSTGEIDGVIYRQGDEEADPAGEVLVQLVDNKGDIIKEVQSQYDGFYLIDFIAPGTYTLRVDPEQLARLELPDVESRSIKIGQDGTILNGEDFIIGGAKSDAENFRVRLASFSSREEAEDAWVEIQDALPQMFGDKEAEYISDKVASGNLPVIGLFALKFNQRADAENACVELKANFGDTWCNPLDISIK